MSDRPYDFSVPIDEAHRISLELTGLINEAYEQARRRAAAWQPAPCPPRCTRS